MEVSVSNHLGYWESSHHLRGNDALSLMQRRRNKCIGAKVDIERNSLTLQTFKTADRAEMRDYRFSLPRLFPYLPSDHRATVVVHYNKDSGSGLRKIILEHYFAKTNCDNEVYLHPFEKYLLLVMRNLLIAFFCQECLLLPLM